MRAVSIIMVLLTHLGTYDCLLDSVWGTRLWLTVSGEMGVYVFFVISGFLITTLLLREKQEKGTVSYKRFIARRFLRLLPPLLIFYAVIASLMMSGMMSSGYLSLIVSSVYLYNFIPNKFYVTELGHTWSLAVEEQFYFLWPLAIRFFNRSKWIIISIVTIAASVICIGSFPFIRFQFNDELVYLIDKFKTQRWFLPAIAPVMIGSLSAVLNLNYQQIFSNQFKHKRMLLWSACLIFSAFYVPLFLRNYLLLIQSAGIAILLLFIFHNSNSLLTAVLEYGPISFIGKISYGIYVWQGLFLRTGPGGDLWIQQFPQNIFLTFVAAVFSYLLIERTMQTYRIKLH